jgi:hypothetical protein
VCPNPLSPSTVSPPLMSTCACSVAPAIPTSPTQPHINVDISYAALHVHRFMCPNPLSPSIVSPPLMSTCACSVAPAIPTSPTQPHINVDISYAALHVHRIVNVALHREYSLGIVFIFS